MLDFLKKLFGGTSIDFKKMMEEGAVIVDVRTVNEYQDGHIKGAINIPLQNLAKQLSKLRKDKPVITCCASGMRSAQGKSILKTNGYIAENGGSWRSLQSKI
jgi:rhodanese-related sulfurtransferase